MRKLLPVFILALITGCGTTAVTPTGGAQTAANSSQTATTGGSSGGNATSTAASSDPPKTDTPATAAKPAYREEPLAEPGAMEVKVAPLADAPKGLAEAPKTCSAFVKRKAAAATACETREQALEALDKALSQTAVDKRDGQLAALETCAGLPAGLVRALRAELAPNECGDVIVESIVKSPPAGIDGAMYATLRGLATAARIARTGTTPPTLTGTFDRKRAEEFLNGPMKEWMLAQATAIDTLSKESTRVASYARGIAAIEAGMAELRIVEAVRGAPLSPELKAHPDAANQYYANLDQALDPRKERGRDAALVGLRDLALTGSLHDPRVDKARAFLSRLYGGRRIDALDGLLVPALAKAQPGDVYTRLAMKLPTFYAGVLIPRAEASKPQVLRALLERGIPTVHRLALRDATLATDARRLYARGRLEFGRTYLRAFDFDQAAALWAAIPEAELTDEDKLLRGLVEALRNGPEDAAVMVRNAPVPMLGMGDVKALDAISAGPQKGPIAGMAAFDAALVKHITAPIGADATYFRDIASRYRTSAGLLTEPAHRKAAEDRAQSADLTAGAIH